MRIAVPVADGQFNPHFGQSTAFVICDVQQDPPAVLKTEELPAPAGGGCGTIPGMLSKAGVNVVLAGGIGGGAVENLRGQGIVAVMGVAAGSPRQLAMDYLAGRLVSSGESCQHHGPHGHGHGHGHHGHGACHQHGAIK